MRKNKRNKGFEQQQDYINRLECTIIAQDKKIAEFNKLMEVWQNEKSFLEFNRRY